MLNSYNFCPKCGSKFPPQSSVNLKCIDCDFVFYQNSKPTASVLILNENNEVLLGRRAINPAKGKWDIIGGFLELGESPEAGAIREGKEETGLNIQLENFLGIFMDIYDVGDYHTLNICYTAKITDGELAANDDVSELSWFSKDTLPSDLAFKSGEEMLVTWSKSLSKLS